MACQRELALVLSPAGSSWEIFSFFKTNMEFLIPIVFSLKLHKCPIHWEGKDKEADQRIQSNCRHRHSYGGSHYSKRCSHEPKLFLGGFISSPFLDVFTKPSFLRLFSLIVLFTRWASSSPQCCVFLPALPPSLSIHLVGLGEGELKADQWQSRGR